MNTDSLMLDAKPNVSSSTSWLGRWFSRPPSTNPGPIKAKLGEETSFYYDKELKRWVNKKVGKSSFGEFHRI